MQVFATGPSENASVISYYNAALAGLAGPALMGVGSAMVRCLSSRRLRWHPAVCGVFAQPQTLETANIKAAIPLDNPRKASYKPVLEEFDRTVLWPTILLPRSGFAGMPSRCHQWRTDEPHPYLYQKVETALAAGDADAAREALRVAQPEIQRGVTRVFCIATQHRARFRGLPHG